MKRRFAAIAIVGVSLFASSCASYLRVTTEVYAGKPIEDPLPAAAAESATIALRTLDGYEDRARAAGAESYTAVLRKLTKGYRTFFGDASSLPAYESSLKPVLEDALRPAHQLAEEARSLARQLGAPGGDPSRTFKDAANLEQGLLQLKSLLDRTAAAGRDAVHRINATEVEQYRATLRDSFLHSKQESHIVKKKKVMRTVFPNDPVLTEKSGLKIVTMSDRVKAIDDVLSDIQEAPLTSLEKALVIPPQTASSVVVAKTVVPLDDQAIPIILTAPDSDWRKAVNDVVSWNWFGNSEVAFRMDSLGDSHIKGILFDPSEVMKTGFNVFTKALEVTASAYGATFAGNTTDTTTTGTSTGSTDTTTTSAQSAVSTPGAPSKPAIDAELLRNASKDETRNEVLEAMFRRITEIGKALPADDTAAASGAAKKLLATVKCAQDELADPQGRLCGGD